MDREVMIARLEFYLAREFGKLGMNARWASEGEAPWAHSMSGKGINLAEMARKIAEGAPRGCTRVACAFSVADAGVVLYYDFE